MNPRIALVCLAALSPTALGAHHGGIEDMVCPAGGLTEPPVTVYEYEAITAQNMDYDKVNKMFPAHAGWYKDLDIHYYKFRMHTPSTYPNENTPTPTNNNVPIQEIYMMTTDGTLDGVVGNPVISYHNNDTYGGDDYSDFMHVNLVEVPANYTPNTYDSTNKIKTAVGDGEANLTQTGTFVNLPVVPTDSKLQKVGATDNSAAPIDPTPVFFCGVEVWTYVFEVTTQGLADYFNYTRPEGDEDYKIYVVDFAYAQGVVHIPIWHVNQYTRGVTEGTNSGGPSPKGMKNVIDLDRGNQGYSPLWQVRWVTETPIDYTADEASHADQFKEANGFKIFLSPMFVNCPDIGAVGTTTNPNKSTTYKTAIDKFKDSNWILGAHQSTIMQGGKNITFETKQTAIDIDVTQTNPMGAYEYELKKADLPASALTVVVKNPALTAPDSPTIREIRVTSPTPTPTPTSDTPSTFRRSAVVIGGCVLAAVLLVLGAM